MEAHLLAQLAANAGTQAQQGPGGSYSSSEPDQGSTNNSRWHMPTSMPHTRAHSHSHGDHTACGQDRTACGQDHTACGHSHGSSEAVGSTAAKHKYSLMYAQFTDRWVGALMLPLSHVPLPLHPPVSPHVASLAPRQP